MNTQAILSLLQRTGQAVRKKTYASLRSQSVGERTRIVAETKEDSIYQIDRDVEEILLPLVEAASEEVGGVVLIAEGVGDEEAVVYPVGLPEDQARIRIIMDPIDGTRGIMYDKRSAFFLAGAAPNRGAETRLRDIEIAVMTELPTSRSYLSDTLWAIRGQGAFRSTRNLLTDEDKPGALSPSRAESIFGGFGQISRFFPPGKEILAQIEEEMIACLFPQPPAGKAILFNDQYISSGGQLYEMLMGHDRFVADLRATLYRRMQKEGKWIGLTCHPYDVCAHLIGEEAGLIITDAAGHPLDAPMNTTGDVDWIAYANPSIRGEVETVLLRLLKQHGFESSLGTSQGVGWIP